MEGSGGGDGSAERSTARRVAPGQVWIACVLCGRPVELSDAVATPDGYVCPECSVGQ